MSTVVRLGGGDPDAMGRLAALSGQNVFACYQCGKCTAGCPFDFNPQRVVRQVQLGQLDAAAAEPTTWSCASCLTCQANCPKGVSPARLMAGLRTLVAEGTVAGRDGHGHRIRSMMLANNHRLARLGSALAPASNLPFRLPGAGLVQEGLIGVHHERLLPPFARPSFPAWFSAHEPFGDGRRGRVLLFHDTFMDFHYPDIGIAATELLERAGFRVELTDSVCCGRAMISKGFTKQAAVQARENTRRLARQVEDSYIVGCEPSCLLTLRNEYPELVDGPETSLVASRSLLLDEFLERLAEADELELSFGDPAAGRRVLFQGHCHQKALAHPSAAVSLLRRAGYEPEMISAGCCGMAGSFGYEKEHYELSRLAGEKAVVPAVRAAPDAQVVVMGVSCRQQIEHFTGRPTSHLAQALRSALTTEPK